MVKGRKKTAALILSLGIIFLFCFLYIPSEWALINSVGVSPGGDSSIDNIYTTGIPLSKVPNGKINVYCPRYKPADLSQAAYYCTIFGFEDNCAEDDDAYVYTGSEGELSVYKHVNKIEYRSFLEADPEARPEISDRQAIQKAVAFAEDNLLVFNYEEVLVEFEEGVFYITFINRLGNLKNFGFTNSMRLTGSGEVISLELFYVSYDKLNSFQVKSMQDAYYELPLDFDKEVEVLINSCQLVYVYENSIIQPAYYFEGTVSDGTYFESFVKAAVFSQ